MVVNCTQCGKAIKGEVVAPGGEGELTWWDGHRDVVLEPERELGFCSNRCAWRYGLDHHKAWGMSGKAARRHLVDPYSFPGPGCSS